MNALPLFPSTASLFLDSRTVHAVGPDLVQSTEFVSGEAAELWLESAGYEHRTGGIWRLAVAS